MRIRSAVNRTPAATPAEAAAHFDSLLRFETDCWDVHHAIEHRANDFVLLDVRSPEHFEREHVPEAINLPHPGINKQALEPWGEEDTVFVVYCAGPHCNGADKAALRLSKLGRQVKKMIGGMEGWRDEGFEFESESLALHSPQVKALGLDRATV